MTAIVISKKVTIIIAILIIVKKSRKYQSETYL